LTAGRPGSGVGGAGLPGQWRRPQEMWGVDDALSVVLGLRSTPVAWVTSRVT